MNTKIFQVTWIVVELNTSMETVFCSVSHSLPNPAFL